MSAKSIFIIITTVLITVVLMNNTDEVNFWIFGQASIPKLAILGTMFGLGWIIGFLMGRPGSRSSQSDEYDNYTEIERSNHASKLSPEDQDYIS
ncbi:MAG: hypothetical protein ACKOW2_03645 [Sphingobacteriaceae bacterium]